MNTNEMFTARTPQHCAQCTAHGEISLLKGHKNICPFKDCTCVHCNLVNNKRLIMAKQVKLKRLQEKNHGLSRTTKRRRETKNRSASSDSGSISPENKYVYTDTDSAEISDMHDQFQEETWRVVCGSSSVQPVVDDHASQTCPTSEQWYPVSPMRFSHINPLRLSPMPSFLHPYSPSVSIATSYLSSGVTDSDFMSLNHIQTQPVYYTSPGYAVSLAQANQLATFPNEGFPDEAFSQPPEPTPVAEGIPQSIDAAQTLLTLHTGEE